MNKTSHIIPLLSKSEAIAALEELVQQGASLSYTSKYEDVQEWEHAVTEWLKENIVVRNGQHTLRVSLILEGAIIKILDGPQA